MQLLSKRDSRWVTRRLSNVKWKYRQATGLFRAPPDFIIIGAQKAGTTSLFHYLAQHPQLIPAYEKEIHFFDGGRNPNVDTFNKGGAWYRSHFPIKRHVHDTQKVYEASPLYLFNPLVPNRIHTMLPEIKMIALLRNPVERAISHYFHEERKGRLRLPIIEALQAEDDCIASAIERQDFKDKVFIHQSFKSRGLYAEQLKRYLDLFARKDILILNSDTLFTQPDETLRRVFQFIDVDPEFKVADLKPRTSERTGARSARKSATISKITLSAPIRNSST